jgi:hypothetical protein
LKGHVGLLQGNHRTMNVLRLTRHQSIDGLAGLELYVIGLADGSLQ